MITGMGVGGVESRVCKTPRELSLADSGNEPFRFTVVLSYSKNIIYGLDSLFLGCSTKPLQHIVK